MRRGVTGWNTPKMTQNTRTQRQCVVAQRLPYCWFLCPPELTHTVIGLEMRVGVEERPSAKSRLNDLSLLTESGPLISRPYLSTLVVSACHVSIWISPLSSRIDPAGKGEPAWTCSFVDSEQHWVPTRLELLSLKVQYNWCCNKTYEMTHAKVTRVCVCIASGGRDRRGGPVLTFPSRSNHDRIRTDDLRRLIAYLAGIPRLHFHYIYFCMRECGLSVLCFLLQRKGGWRHSASQNKQPERADDLMRRHVRESRCTRDVK